MKFEIIHETHFKYSDRIFLEPHIVRLTPRGGMFREIIEHAIDISPQPQGLSELFDLNGTRAFCAWFSEMTDALSVSARTVIELNEENPFNFITYPSSALKLPIEYEPHEFNPLKAALNTESINQPEIKKFALDLASQSNWDTLKFLMELCRHVQEQFSYEPRIMGDALKPIQTFNARRGSCRDFALFCLSACRAVGLASRLASGYLLHNDPGVPVELHAWFEVYIPSAGWKGFDPTHGVMCYQNHVTLASGYDARAIAPISGTFRGYASAHMRHRVQVKTFEAAAS